jgi:CheY-like chemotaxis protein
MPSVHAFCPSCGGNVECNVVIDGEKRQLRCKNCKFLVEEKKIVAAPVQAMTFAVPDANPAAHASPAMPARTPPPVAAAPMRTLGTVLSAEDTPAIRMALQNLLVAKGVARNVVSVENGFDALIAFHRATRAGAQLDLLILDVNMPILDGINAAVCVRAAEKAAGTPPHPILFFTSNVCDEPFRRALEYLAPARYLNKGQAASGAELGERLVAVLQNLLGGGA